MMFLDTSGFLCLLSKRELFHLQANELFAAAGPTLTHSLVISEFVPLAVSRGVHRVGVLNFVDGVLLNPDIETVWADEALVRDGLRLLFNRVDKNYSLCDAVSFLLMRARGLTDALTTDKHFEQEGFRRLLV
jgi:predicted nucleic acid-binding protein